MAERRGYAGPHDATEVQIADGVYTTILNENVPDSEVAARGYTLDDEATAADGIFVRRSVVVSDHLAATMPVEVFPRLGGVVNDDDIIDDPRSNPATSLAVANADAGIEQPPTVAEVNAEQTATRVAALDERLAELDRDRDRRVKTADELRVRLEAGVTYPDPDDAEKSLTRPLTDAESASINDDLAALDNASAQDASIRAAVVAERDKLNG